MRKGGRTGYDDGTHSYAWDGEGRPVQIDTTALTYDALGRIIEKAVSTVYTQMVYSPTGGKLALMSGQTLSKAFVPLPGGATAVYTASGLAYYRHADWLGSSRVASTPTRTKYYDVAGCPTLFAFFAKGWEDQTTAAPSAAANTQTCNYTYDDLTHIKTANCGTPWNQTFSFDPFGNIGGPWQEKS